MAEDWDTDPNFIAAPDSKGTGRAAVANPFMQLRAEKATEKATEQSGPPVAVKVRRANSFDRFGGGGVRCALCDKKVYAAEQRLVGTNTYHKECFRCSKEGCSKLLHQDYCIESSTGKAYCKPHYMQLPRAGAGSVAGSVGTLGT